MTDNQELRNAAIHSLKRKAAFRNMAISFVIIWIFLIVIWFATGRGYFWPIWPIIGMGIGLAFSGFGAYGKSNDGAPNESQINDEMKRLGGGS